VLGMAPVETVNDLLAIFFFFVLQYIAVSLVACHVEQRTDYSIVVYCFNTTILLESAAYNGATNNACEMAMLRSIHDLAGETSDQQELARSPPSAPIKSSRIEHYQI
jgi:hypothetical protein